MKFILNKMDYQGKIRTLFPNRTNITNDELKTKSYSTN